MIFVSFKMRFSLCIFHVCLSSASSPTDQAVLARLDVPAPAQTSRVKALIYHSFRLEQSKRLSTVQARPCTLVLVQIQLFEHTFVKFSFK